MAELEQMLRQDYLACMVKKMKAKVCKMFSDMKAAFFETINASSPYDAGDELNTY